MKQTFGGDFIKGHKPEMKKGVQALKEDFIALQSEWQPIDFKNMSIKYQKVCMNPKAKNYKKIHLKDYPEPY